MIRAGLIFDTGSIQTGANSALICVRVTGGHVAGECSLVVAWHLFVRTAIECTTAQLLIGAPPLFEEESYFRPLALLLDIFDPLLTNRTGLTARIATDDHSVNTR